MNDKTKQKNTEEVKQVTETIKKVAENKESKYKRGDTVTANGKNCKVVEVIAIDRWHLKNLDTPFDSFIITEDDLVAQKTEDAPDLLYRTEKNISL